MAGEPVRVLARVIARPGAEEALAAVLAALVIPTRREPGCLEYEVVRDREAPERFAVIERWADDAAIAAHMASSHVARAFAEAGPLLAGSPEIRTFRTIA